jgi:hypothetical protein
MHEHYIARRREAKTLADGTVLEADAGLVWLEGNRAPYFSVQGTLWKSSSHARAHADAGYLAGGCLHEEILEHFPQLAPVVALHLSDDDGTPMHAEENARYHVKQGDRETAARLLRVAPAAAVPSRPARMGSFVRRQRPRWKREAARALAILEAGPAELELPAGPSSVFDRVTLDIVDGPESHHHESWAHNAWKVRLSYDGRRMTLPYRTGLAIEEPELGDVLSGLLREAWSYDDAGGDLELFAAEYGLEETAPETARTFQAVRRQTEKLAQLLGDDYASDRRGRLMAGELERVRRTAQAVRRARDNYRAAVLEAADAGEPAAAIAHAAGIRRQSARGLVERLRVERGRRRRGEAPNALRVAKTAMSELELRYHVRARKSGQARAPAARQDARPHPRGARARPYQAPARSSPLPPRRLVRAPAGRRPRARAVRPLPELRRDRRALRARVARLSSPDRRELWPSAVAAGALETADANEQGGPLVTTESPEPTPGDPNPTPEPMPEPGPEGDGAAGERRPQSCKTEGAPKGPSVVLRVAKRLRAVDVDGARERGARRLNDRPGGRARGVAGGVRAEARRHRSLDVEAARDGVLAGGQVTVNCLSPVAEPPCTVSIEPMSPIGP